MIAIDVPDNENGLSPSMEAEALSEGERLFITGWADGPRDHLAPPFLLNFNEILKRIRGTSRQDNVRRH